MPTIRDTINDTYDELKAHKNYAQELQGVAKILKSTEDREEEYRDWINFPDGEVQVKVTKAINPQTQKPFTVAEKNKIKVDCQSAIAEIRSRKPV